MKRNKKILLAGASTYGVRNMGDDAMLYNLTCNLHQKIDCSITFLARHPKAEYDRLYGINSIKNYEFDSKKESRGKFFFGFNPDDPQGHLRKIREAIAKCDLVIIGGNSFMEVSPNQFMRGVASYSALLATFAILFQKPFVLYGVAGQRLQNEWTKQIARFLCRNAKLVTIREEYFRNALKEAGATGNLKVFADPAFAVDPVIDSAVPQRVFRREKIRFKNPNIVGIGFRHMYWSWNDKQFSVYSQKMARFCDFIVSRMNADLLFIPNCTYSESSPWQDDRNVTRFVIRKMKYKNHAHLVKREMDLLETLSLYPKLDMLISNRRHSCIFSAINMKPMLAMSTDNRFHLQTFMDELKLGKNVVSLTKDRLEAIKSKACAIWSDRSGISRTLAGAIPPLRKRAQLQVDAIVGILKRYKK